jgi:transposase
MDETLFPLQPAQEGNDQEDLVGRPRLKRPNRAQITFRPSSLEEMVPEEHPVRLIWEWVEQLDLSPLYQEIRAVEGHAGQSAIDPKILMALWLYATLEGVGSARALDRLCKQHVAYLWILGGVTINYHTLADFRVQHEETLDRLLTQSVAALMNEGLVSLKRTAQDGVRIRASASRGSFVERPTLEEHLAKAEEQVCALREELEADPGRATRRERAARERTRRERKERLEKALEQMKELEKKQRKSHKPIAKRKAPKVSTSDPEARFMRMADGGFRPAYNGQLAVDTESRVVVGLDIVDTVDQGQMAPMVWQVEDRYEQTPAEHLADPGFATLEDIEALTPPQGKTLVYIPLPEQPTGPWSRAQPSVAVAAWRERMHTDEAQMIYRERASSVEWVIAVMRNWGLQQFRVRGLQKVKAVLLWFALLHNLLRAHALRLAARAGPQRALACAR